jgi:hypothetical protein
LADELAVSYIKSLPPFFPSHLLPPGGCEEVRINMDFASPTPESNVPTTRGYQQEMLEESIKRNIIIAMDTGSGKTHIAVLRIKHEVEREPSKVRA